VIEFAILPLALISIFAFGFLKNFTLIVVVYLRQLFLFMSKGAVPSPKAFLASFYKLTHFCSIDQILSSHHSNRISLLI